jgi:hypothetical protein
MDTLPIDIVFAAADQAVDAVVAFNAGKIGATELSSELAKASGKVSGAVLQNNGDIRR